jgi:hypothetical protein
MSLLNCLQTKGKSLCVRMGSTRMRQNILKSPTVPGLMSLDASNLWPSLITQYINQTVSSTLVHSIHSWIFLVENRVYRPYFAKLAQAINQFKTVHQSRQQLLRAYCLNIYTVPDNVWRAFGSTSMHGMVFSAKID